MTRTSSVEREQKLAGWAGFELPDLGGVVDGAVAVPMPELQLEAAYYDTGDLRLARSGISVRHRTGEGPQGKWTVKFPGASDGQSLTRREVDVPGTGRQVPEDVASLVRAHVRSSLLAPVGTLQTRRRRVEVRIDGRRVAEVADDEVSVLEGRRVALRFREIEVELTADADADVLDAIVARLLEAGAARADQTPKIVRALGPRALEPPDLVAPRLDPERATVREVVAASIADGLGRLLRHDPGIRLGGDIEDVHQARVAARRLRSDLRTFRHEVEAEPTARLREELQWLGAVLGGVRDCDVLHERLRDQIELLPTVDARAGAALIRRLEVERKAARAEVLAALDSDRYLALLDALAAAIVDPPVDEEAGAVLARRALPGIVRGPWRHLQKAVDELGDHPEDEALHDLRIRAKRARYAAEAAAPVFGKQASKFAKAVAGLQSVLGDLQDAVVAETWLRAAGAKGPAAQAVVAGQLLVIQRQAMAESRADWPAAWEDLASKKLRAWLS